VNAAIPISGYAAAGIAVDPHSAVLSG